MPDTVHQLFSSVLLCMTADVWLKAFMSLVVQQHLTESGHYKDDAELVNNWRLLFVAMLLCWFLCFVSLGWRAQGQRSRRALC